MNSTETPPIELDVKIDFSDYWRATYSYMLGNWKVRTLLAAGILGPLLFLLSNTLEHDGNPHYELLLPFVGMAFLFVILYLNTQVVFSGKKFLQHHVRYVFSNSGVEALAPDSPGHKNWSEIPKAFELKQDFLIFYTTERMYTVPKKCFHDEGQIIRLRKMLASCLGDKAKLRT